MNSDDKGTVYLNEYRCPMCGGQLIAMGSDDYEGDDRNYVITTYCCQNCDYFIEEYMPAD